MANSAQENMPLKTMQPGNEQKNVITETKHAHGSLAHLQEGRIPRRQVSRSWCTGEESVPNLFLQGGHSSYKRPEDACKIVAIRAITDVRKSNSRTSLHQLSYFLLYISLFVFRYSCAPQYRKSRDQQISSVISGFSSLPI